jgi:hypothetical protein
MPAETKNVQGFFFFRSVRSDQRLVPGSSSLMQQVVL